MENPSIGEIVMMTLLRRGAAQLSLGLFACLLLQGASVQNANAQEQIGQSIKIHNQVEGSVGTRLLDPRDPVYAEEIVTAFANSHGEFILNDNSKVLVGENARVELDDFVVASSGIERGVIRVFTGAMRFVSGNSPTGTFTIETPVSAIGIRGTRFDVYVPSPSATYIVHFEGALEICRKQGGRVTQDCVIEDDPCDIVEVTTEGFAERPYLRSRASSRSEQDSSYPLTTNQFRFDPRFWAPTLACSVRAAFDFGQPRRDGGNRPITIFEPGGNEGSNERDRGDRDNGTSEPEPDTGDNNPDPGTGGSNTDSGTVGSNNDVGFDGPIN
jgi:hypothetical protein